MKAKLGIEFEAFRHGPDGGVDLRSTGHDPRVIVQCKHYGGSTFATLKRAAVKEKSKMDALRPKDYYFVTSQDLTLTQKDALLGALRPHAADSGKILASRDLNALLGEHPEIEKNHFKLWIASAAVIQRIVHSGLWERSTALMEEIQDRVRLYVSTTSFGEARQMLERNHVCVIVGGPGVGKSMIADMLALTHWESGWQVVSLASHEVDRCWDMWQKDVKQLFYFDDVFGQTDIQERLGNDSGLTVARLVRRVGSSPSKRMVITSRTHVMRDAALRDEPIDRSSLRARECVVKVGDYTRLLRGRVLYNHLYFSNLSRSVIAQFLRNGGHWRVIDHRSFTPRIIEQVILQDELAEQSDLEKRMTAALNEPVLLWGPSFRESLDEVARLVLLHLAAYPVIGAPLNELRASSIRQSTTPFEYRRALAQLEGSWIRLAEVNDLGVCATFNDPSCRDFVLSVLNAEVDYVRSVLEHATDAVQVSQVAAYATSVEWTSGSRTDRTARWKYPQLRSYIAGDVGKLVELIKAAWSCGSTMQDYLATETLGSIHRISSQLNLGLDGWIADRLLEVAPALRRYPEVDSGSTTILASVLTESDRQLTSAEHVDACSRLFTGWSSVVSEVDEWDDLIAFAGWISSANKTSVDPPLLGSSDFREVFSEWLDGEIDSAFDNSDERDQLDQWLTGIERCTEKVLGLSDVDSKLRDAHERAGEKWDRDPDPSDIEYAMRASEAGGVVEKSSTLESLTAPTHGYRSESQRIQDDIANLFIQLNHGD